LGGFALRQSSTGNELDVRQACLLHNSFIGYSYGDLGEHYCGNDKGNWKLNTRAVNAILGAAIIDDILGIVAQTFNPALMTQHQPLLVWQNRAFFALRAYGFAF
jgi:hypothetical protein